MAAWTGILTPSIFVEDTLRCSATIIDNTVVSPVDVCMLESIIQPDVGAWHSYLPVEQIERSRTGTKVDSFLDDYYYRIHVTPATFDLGAVLSDRVDEFIVWNAFFVQKSCSDIAETYPDEFEMAGLAAPFDLEALEYSTFTITVPKEGSAEFISTITFDFGAAGVRAVTISGTRMIVFAYCPKPQIRELLEWLTDIIAGTDGSEQRSSVRQVPRQSFGLDIVLRNTTDQARFDAALFGWQKRSWGVPVWPELVIHTGAIAADDMTIAVDTTNADFRDDSYALIWKSLTEYEAVRIETKSDSLLTLETAVQNTWTGRKLIMPLRIAQIVSAVKKSNLGPVHAGSSLLFAVKDNVLVTGYSPDQTYKDLPVLTESAVMGRVKKDTDSSSDSFSQDYKSGDFDFFSDSDFNIISQNWGFYNNTRAVCWGFRQFLHSLYGMQGLCWAPTYKPDVTATETIGAADTSFRIENIKLAVNMGLNDLRTDLAFIFTDGTILPREITGIVESDDDEEIISIDSALGVEVAVGGCRICFLDKVRLASDAVTINWLALDTNRAYPPFVAVKQ